MAEISSYADRDRRLAIVASNGGSPTHPSWYYNVKANRRIEVEVGTETFTVLAEELPRSARADIWPKLIAASPTLGQFETKTTRTIPLFVLTRTDGAERARDRAPRVLRLPGSVGWAHEAVPGPVRDT